MHCCEGPSTSNNVGKELISQDISVESWQSVAPVVFSINLKVNSFCGRFNRPSDDT
jgi:hypothetical protein